MTESLIERRKKLEDELEDINSKINDNITIGLGELESPVNNLYETVLGVYIKIFGREVEVVTTVEDKLNAIQSMYGEMLNF